MAKSLANNLGYKIVEAEDYTDAKSYKSMLDDVKKVVNKMKFEGSGKYVADRILRQLEQM